MPTDFSAADFVIRVLPNDTQPLHGGKIWLFSKTSLEVPWFTKKTSHTGAPQGNPLWFLNTFGEAVAKFFGFQEISRLELLIPNGPELNGAIVKVNLQLKEMGARFSIPVTFYRSYAERVKVFEYLTDFAMDGALPLADGYQSMVHDISYHAAAILLPPKLISLARSQTYFLLRFLNEIQESKVASKIPQLDEKIFYAMMVKLGEIDEGTANSVLGLNSLTHALRETLIDDLLHIAHGGVSPKKYLEDAVAKMNDPVVNKLFEQFVEENSIDPSFTEGLPKEELSELCNEIPNNISSIQNAVQAIQEKQRTGVKP